MGSSRPKPEDTEQVTLDGIIFTHKNLETVVNDFYTSVSKDPVLQVPFQSVHDWPEHIARMTHFWWIKFGGRPYLFNQYNPIPKHFFAGFNATFLERWLGLFTETLNADLQPAQAKSWLTLASRIGDFLSRQNEIYKQAHEAKANES